MAPGALGPGGGPGTRALALTGANAEETPEKLRRKRRQQARRLQKRAAIWALSVVGISAMQCTHCE